MLTITLTNGEIYHLTAETSVQLVHGRGTYGNGSIDWEKEQLSLAEIAAKTHQSHVVAAEVEGRLLPLSALIKQDCLVDFITLADKRGQEMAARTGVFLLAYGVAALQKGWRRLAGGAENGYIYYDFAAPADSLLTVQDLAAAEKAIQRLMAEKLPITLAKLPYYVVLKALTAQQETYLIQEIIAHDDGGPVEMNVCAGFQELSHGLLLPHCGDCPSLAPLKLQSIPKGYRVYSQLLV